MERLYAWAIIDWKTGIIEKGSTTNSWEVVKENCFGIKGSRYRKFNNLQEAEDWLENPIIKGRFNYYAIYSPIFKEVIQGDYPRLIDIQNAHKEEHLEDQLKYKGFDNKEEAQSWLETMMNNTA
ncbi:viroplasmin family protein [Brassicibacter mesophilus]|uniref:ribonuclease H1 domain-containing protein n=1 Tax=Brassicibacter mesophilus TaxID=745119 RepID=UPI003D234765